MRLLNTVTCDIVEYISDDGVPKYAILSHTWGDHEISLIEWQNRHSLPIGSESTQGAAKVSACCQLAAASGLEWVWIDTCCIDKSSSAELSEAINSMFRWYKNAAVCYAYLSDVESASQQSEEARKGISKSRWFTRGWTLQELLAPKEVIFYSKDWQPLGTKADFAHMISSITRIGRKFLDGESLELASIAQKMSWAADRQTTRSEDRAYCLLGIFDINMPLLYGERYRAFQRLQEVLLTTYPEDHSLYAWGRIVNGFPDIPPDIMFGTNPIPWSPPEPENSLYGMLASSPADFIESYNIVACRTAAQDFYHRASYDAELPRLARRGAIRLQLPMDEPTHMIHHFTDMPIAQIRKVFTLLLLCQYDDPTKHIGRFFVRVTLADASKYSRVGPLVYVSDTGKPYLDYFEQFQNNALRPRTTLAPEPRFSFQPGDIVFRRTVCSPESDTRPAWIRYPPPFEFSFKEGHGVLRPEFASDKERDEFYFMQCFNADAAGSQDIPVLSVSLTREKHPATGELCVKFEVFVPKAGSAAGTGSKSDHEVVAWVSRNRVVYYSFSPLCDSAGVMRPEGYSWVVDERPRPRIFIQVERFEISTGATRGFIDAVDIVVGPRGIGDIVGRKGVNRLGRTTRGLLGVGHFVRRVGAALR
ncbi:vegetative incompatibility protein HET-E-1 [Echria macrotheca]|uniref:Vegetative incompatibility protein HET-E-1 n=1 Tax=Echria macrotheca TaxID=438768 RepID=A0AAJ0B945_9PEZI|nr:vegetative incompatibility protein HET-E-1 [Echria macrotheca]